MSSSFDDSAATETGVLMIHSVRTLGKGVTRIWGAVVWLLGG